MKSQNKGRGLFLLQMIILFLLPINVFAQSCVQPPTGIIAWWPFDETEGATAEDRIGNHPGAHTNGPVPADGMVGGSLRFDGRNDYVAVADSDLWTFGSNNFTLEFWANFDAAGGGSIGHPGDIFIGHDDGPGTRNKWFFALGGGALNFHINGRSTGSRFFPRAPFSPTAGEWYHLAITRDGSLYTIFVNGVPATSTTDTRVIPNSSAPLTIGQAEFLGFMNGRLDEVTIYDRALTEEELRAISDAGAEGKCKELQIRPEAGGDTGTVTVTITGGPFEEGASVKLVKPSELDIVGESVLVEQDGRVITTTFDLSGQALGLWDVVITNQDGSIVMLEEGFAIEEGSFAEIWVDVVGLNVIRPERAQTFHIFYGNRGNVDAGVVPLWISGIPNEATVIPKFNMTPLLPANTDPISIDEVPFHLAINNELVIPLLISKIPPNTTKSISVEISIPNQVGAFTIKSWASKPFFSGTQIANPDLIACIAGIAKKFLPSNVDCGANFGEVVGNALADIFVDKKPRDIGSYVRELAAILNACVGIGKFKRIEYAMDMISAIVSGIELGEACGNVVPPPSPPGLPVSPIGSFDPNDKIGSQGAGLEQYISGEESLRYSIFFENLENATAPAQEVIIIDQLDVVNLNLGTYAPGPVSFGNSLVTPPPGVTNYTSDVVVPGQVLENLFVRITSSLNTSSGILTWRLSAIDPATGNPPIDPREGFLPPNVNPPEGDGYVLFTIKPKNLPTGTEICNKANIVFDTNEQIVTPDWCNTLDNDTPRSAVIGLDTIQPSTDFEVHWDGTDVGAGIRDYTIYVSEDGASYTQWLTNTADTMGVFSGEDGKTYDFYSIARDGTGNLEEAPTIPDTSTTVVLIPSMIGDFNGDACVDRGDYNILMTDIRNGEPNDPKHDLNEDGIVNRADARSLVGLFTNPRGATCQQE